MSKAPRSTVSLITSAKLVMLIEAEFVSSGKTDTEFASYASEKLGEPVNERNVKTRRAELGIKSRAELDAEKKLGGNTQFVRRLEALENQVAQDQKEFKGIAEVLIALRQRIETLEGETP